ncbi:hypothetical protein [Streptomyces sp. NBC_00893]|uniref:hypothetical protein n=1 Tax=Streptomyces sp. NBC_00893 TaxID=2975862 RepID=UPI00224D4654|nr:hypothetical protein [Streptomyces sp. NBC_00893]MCX4850249.1 hypothetical protein [Streptomyces sp. NBC_00893]
MIHASLDTGMADEPTGRPAGGFGRGGRFGATPGQSRQAQETLSAQRDPAPPSPRHVHQVLRLKAGDIATARLRRIRRFLGENGCNACRRDRLYEQRCDGSDSVDIYVLGIRIVKLPAGAERLLPAPHHWCG